MADNQKPTPLKKILRCRGCGGFLAEVTFIGTLMQNPPVGPVVRVRGIKCDNRKCKLKNDDAVGVDERGEKTVEDALIDIFQKDQEQAPKREDK